MQSPPPQPAPRSAIERQANMTVRQIAVLIAALAASGASGCSQKSIRISAPEINASSAASSAMQEYDVNRDGKISGAELDRCPALKGLAGETGGDAVSADTIAGRIGSWQQTKTGRMMVGCVVRHNGQPLAGAVVDFVPEKFLGPKMLPGKGTTDATGGASISTAVNGPLDRPGLPPGFYRVEITKPGESIPARYNSETTLGEEITPVGKRRAPLVVQYDLKY
jgi:hypothetical protein